MPHTSSIGSHSEDKNGTEQSLKKQRGEKDQPALPSGQNGALLAEERYFLAR